MKSKVALAVAIVLAILAAIGIKFYLTTEARKYRQSARKVDILVADKRIPKGAKITPDMLTGKEVDASSVQGSGIVFANQLDRLLDMELPIRRTVERSEPIRWEYFGSKAERALPSDGLEHGYRQITIPVDKVTGCAGRLVPGTIVDVLSTLRVRRGGDGPIQPVTQVALTNVRVAATDLHSAAIYEFRSRRQRRELAAYSTVTLRVTPRQANILAFLAEQGKLHLVIRHPADSTLTDPTKHDKVTFDNLDELIRQAAREKPAAE